MDGETIKETGEKKPDLDGIFGRSGLDSEEKVKRGRKPKPPVSPVDAKHEGEDAVEILDSFQTTISARLAFSEKDKGFHSRTVSLYSEHYGVKPTAILLHVRGGVSVLKVLWHWGKTVWTWIKEKPEPKKIEPVK